MIINFKQMEETIKKHFYDGNKELNAKMYVDEKNKILYGKLVPGASIGLHTHETSCEVIYIISGTGKVLYDGQYETVEEGNCHYCPKGHSHSLINDSDNDLIFFAVVPAQ
ncbi:MAG TPA: cupin domain-containing protein [Bacilli bacterium]